MRGLLIALSFIMVSSLCAEPTTGTAGDMTTTTINRPLVFKTGTDTITWPGQEYEVVRKGAGAGAAQPQTIIECGRKHGLVELTKAAAGIAVPLYAMSTLRALSNNERAARIITTGMYTDAMVSIEALKQNTLANNPYYAMMSMGGFGATPMMMGGMSPLMMGGTMNPMLGGTTTTAASGRALGI